MVLHNSCCATAHAALLYRRPLVRSSRPENLTAAAYLGSESPCVRMKAVSAKLDP